MELVEDLFRFVQTDFSSWATKFLVTTMAYAPLSPWMIYHDIIFSYFIFSIDMFKIVCIIVFMLNHPIRSCNTIIITCFSCCNHFGYKIKLHFLVFHLFFYLTTFLLCFVVAFFFLFVLTLQIWSKFLINLFPLSRECGRISKFDSTHQYVVLLGSVLFGTDDNDFQLFLLDGGCAPVTPFT